MNAIVIIVMRKNNIIETKDINDSLLNNKRAIAGIKTLKGNEAM